MRCPLKFSANIHTRAVSLSSTILVEPPLNKLVTYNATVVIFNILTTHHAFQFKLSTSTNKKQNDLINLFQPRYAKPDTLNNTIKLTQFHKMYAHNIHRLIKIICKITAHRYTHTKPNFTTQLVPTSRISSCPLPWQIARKHSIPISNNNLQSQYVLNNINSTLKAKILFISSAITTP
jgi:hypothetical protein